MPITENDLKNLLLEKKIIGKDALESIESFAKDSDMPLSEALVEKNIISDEELGKLVADFLKVPFVALSKISIPQDVYTIVPERMARKQKILPFERDKKGIKLAMVDPRDVKIADMIAKKTDQKVTRYLATEKDILNNLHSYKKNLQLTFDELITDEAAKANTQQLEDAPIVKIVDLLIRYAYQDKSSDIHIEPEEQYSLIRFRIDGILHDVLKLPKSLHDRITTRIKILARLRTDEHLSAQDGKMRLRLEEEHLDIRVSILPTVEGEKVVLRLLSSKAQRFSLESLGMSQVDLKKISKAISKSYGMVLSTGPTGSGKTTSIYTILKMLHTREKNITTIEDPVEYRIKGVNQIQVNPKTQLTFAAGLSSILRQDPNIIFVGEIRDNETAGIAVNAALTGHLVLSTLHTNDAAGALPRLTDMGIEPILVASTVNIIIAQRLVRKICDNCKKAYTMEIKDLAKNVPKDVLTRIPNKKTIQFYKGEGCKICHLTGYNGRLGIFEVLEVNKKIKSLISEKSDADIIADEAIKEGMTTMLDDGLQKAIKGLTTIEEVLRVAKIEFT